MKLSLRLIAWLLGLVPLGLPTTVLAEGSKQLTPNTPATAALPLTDPANTRSGFLEHDANVSNGSAGTTSRAFLKPYNFTRNSSVYNDNQRLYVLLKPGETVYYGVHRVPHNQGTGSQSDLLITARWSADGTGAGTLGTTSKILRDSSTANSTTTLRQAAFLPNQSGVIVDTTQNRVGPKVGGLPTNGYAPLSYSNTTSATQYVWFEFVQHDEAKTAFTDSQRFSVYDFWDFTVKNTATGATKPGRLFSKQWAFSAGATTGRFSATFNMYPLIPSPREVNKYFVKKFALAGLAPQNYFRFVANSKGADPAKVTPDNSFANTTKSQTSEIDYPEYMSFVNDPDPEIWPSAASPDLQVVSSASYCNSGSGVMKFFLRSSLGGQVVIDIELNGTPGYQAGTTDRRISTTIPTGNSLVAWDGKDGLGAVVNSGKVLTLVFQNGTSPIAPVNFPLWDAEDNVSGFRIQNVRPGSQGFDVLYWDDSNLSTTKFPDTPTTPRTQLTGTPSNTGVHLWGGATGSATAAAGDLLLVNTYTYGETQQQTRSFTFTYVCDPDGDGVNDNLDIDQDNDGIPNVVESGGVDPAFITANDVPRYLDAFEANFVDLNNDGVNDVYDLDLDGRPNFLDLDADGDGITDVIEANRSVAPTGYDAALGRFPSTGVGANGMPDVAETSAESGVTNLPLTNTDNTGRPDYLDIDADDDGIVDNIEAQTTAAYLAPLGADTDSDGLDDRYDPTPGGTVVAGTAVPLTKTGTNTADLPDYRDLNSDNDSRLDVLEGWDADNNGVAERIASGLDADNDGLDDAFDNDLTRTNPTNGQTPASFPDYQTGTAERAWREFDAATPVTTTINGRIFEDVNYGGGAGRSYNTANTSAVNSGFADSAILRPGVTVELYDANGAFVATTTTTTTATATAATPVGTYTFTQAATSGNYTVRVVNRTMSTSARSTTATGLLPVQTFANGVVNKVGGEMPSKTDAAARSGSQTLLTIINGTTTTAQSISTIFVPTTATTTVPVSNIDFGFNFDAIVNTSGTGQGSLRQFIFNSNALPNTSLQQTGLTAGVETSIFMISDGRTTNVPAGMRPGVNGGFSGNTATIMLTANLTTISDPYTALDGGRQTAVTGNTIAAVAGITTGPEVVLDYNGLQGLLVTAANTTISSIGLNNARGTTVGSAQQGSAVTFSSSAAAGSVLTDVTAIGNAGAGVRLSNSATGVTVSNSVFSTNVVTAATSTTDPTTGAVTTTPALYGRGITLSITNGNTIRNNTISGNAGYGISVAGSTTTANNIISGNTISGNGIASGAPEPAGISIQQGQNNTIRGNTITGNTGNGIVALAGTTNNILTQNNISANTLLGIDLSSGSAVGGNGVTLNANSKATASGANSLLNFPVITKARTNSSGLQVTGFAPAGATVEFFLASQDASGFGEGQLFIGSLVEGSNDDIDPGTGSYSYNSATDARDQGAETTANRFTFTIPLSADQQTALTQAGSNITATATVASKGTSEFSGNVVASPGPLPVVLTAFTAQAVANRDALLQWTTASEARNDHFEVERSLDGATFTLLGRVAGHGTTSAASAYAFTDAGIGRQVTGPVYYRLRQVDLDGTATYSTVRSISFAPAALVSLSLFPNPTAERTSLDLSALPATSRVQVHVLDATGRAVRSWTLAGGQVQPLDVHTLATGTYLLRVSATQPDGSALHQVLRLTKE